MRKNFIYTFLLLCLASCMNQKSDQATEAVMEDAETERIEETTTVTFEDVLPATVRDKIQERLDAIILIQQHPEFEKTLQSNLQDSAVFAFDMSETIEKVYVTRVEAISAPVSINADDFSQNFKYEIRIDNIQKKIDSVQVIITRKPITIDGERVFDTRFLFRSLQ